MSTVSLEAQHKRWDMSVLSAILQKDNELCDAFRDRLRTDVTLSRSLVSYQASKATARYRWYKYKEAFSPGLIEVLLSRFGITAGRVLDPFAGSGTTLFAASQRALDADGIELLPIGQDIIKTRLLVEQGISTSVVSRLQTWVTSRPWECFPRKIPLATLRITQGAYPSETVDAIEKYTAAAAEEANIVAIILRFALLCILETVSYTRKDGQYLRWDTRAGRRNGIKSFNKGAIPSFSAAMTAKLSEIISDIATKGWGTESLTSVPKHGAITLLEGSVFNALPMLMTESYDAVITSPPYCNRYDYTRTYALELAALGLSEQEMSELRQSMLSCTVENRSKDLLAINPNWSHALDIAGKVAVLQAIMGYLESERTMGHLNNNGIPRMVGGYFLEMACVISECFRLLKRGGHMFMVNDNVRYAGAAIPVDLILSRIAESLGFTIDNILVLPSGKGNSSQQMGHHGRVSLRKCVYVWSKP